MSYRFILDLCLVDGRDFKGKCLKKMKSKLLDPERDIIFIIESDCCHYARDYEIQRD